MEKNSLCLTYLTDLKTALHSDDLSRLDFDHLADWLDHLIHLHDTSARLQAEHESLRHDYLSRITGMLKAIAAVDRTNDRHPAILTTIESLPALSTAELLTCYRHTAARFRDAFPTSFGFLHHDAQAGKRLRAFDDYK